jgi:hypothetical protein
MPKVADIPREELVAVWNRYSTGQSTLRKECDRLGIHRTLVLSRALKQIIGPKVYAETMESVLRHRGKQSASEALEAGE